MATNLRLHSLNDVKVVGRLTKDPEMRFTTGGTAVCHFRVAVSRKYKDKSGEWREEAAFIPCTVWRESAERCGQRLKKGSPVFIEGRLKSREWQTKEGQKRSDLEIDVMRIQFLEAMGEEGQSAPSGVPATAGVTASHSGEEVAGEATANYDDEVPF